jgi:hypothetical protein
MLSQGTPWSSSGRKRWARVSAARASLCSGLVECDACCRRVHERAGRVITEAPLVDARLGLAGESPCLAPLSPLGREERKLCMGDVDDIIGGERESRLDRGHQVIRRALRVSHDRVRCAPDHERARSPATFGREAIQRQIGVGDRLFDALGHHARAQVGEREPPLGLCGPSGQRSEPGSGDGERGVLPQLVVVKPRQPLVQGLQPAS